MIFHLTPKQRDELFLLFTKVRRLIAGREYRYICFAIRSVKDSSWEARDLAKSIVMKALNGYHSFDYYYACGRRGSRVKAKDLRQLRLRYIDSVLKVLTP